MAVEHFLEILKIIEGALSSDREKVVAYTQQLADKLAAEDDPKSAERLKRAVRQTKSQELSPSQFSMTGRIPVDAESRLALADEDHPPLDEVTIFLESEAKETVDEFLRFVRTSDRLIRHGVGVSPSLLLYGPPGCGKTVLGRHISAQLKLPLLTARSDSLISSYLGNTAKNLRLLFDHAMSHPYVLFLDEFDAIGKLRDDKYELGELKRVVVSLLQNIDALDNKTVLVAATNHEHLLDPAIWRRFAFKLKMDLPSHEVRLALFKHFLNEYTDGNNMEILATATDGLTGADIRQIAQDTIRTAVLSDSNTIDFSGALRRILKIRIPVVLKETTPLPEKLLKTRELNKKVFTYRRMANLFDISTGTVSNILHRAGNAHER